MKPSFGTVVGGVPCYVQEFSLVFTCDVPTMYVRARRKPTVAAAAAVAIVYFQVSVVRPTPDDHLTATGKRAKSGERKKLVYIYIKKSQ